MAKMVMVQELKGLAAVRAKTRMKQSSRPKVKAKLPEKKDGQDKA